MKFAQVPIAKHTIAVPGRCVSFGATVPYNMKLWFDGAVGDPVRVQPYDVFTRPFSSLVIQFPGAVNGDDPLEVVVHQTEYAVQKHHAPHARQMAEGVIGMLTGTVAVIQLPPLGFINGGATGATSLVGTVEAANTGNLPTGYLTWTDRNGIERYARNGRFANAIGACFMNMAAWDYPQNGGQIQVQNPATNRNLNYNIWAIQK